MAGDAGQHTPLTTIALDKDWTFREQAGESEKSWNPVAQFPTNVHLDLLALGVIPDPFGGKNELEVQWVGETVWQYQTTFRIPLANGGPSGIENGVAAARPEHKTVLVFEGLDTIATVVLNGREILKSDNMFVPYRIDITSDLLDVEPNILNITFDSAYLTGKKLVENYPNHTFGCWNGDPSRLAIRKAQYHYGWDWGPTLMTCGPWRPVYLEVYSSRIEELYYTSEISDDLDQAEIYAQTDIEGAKSGSRVRFELHLNGKLIESAIASVKHDRASTSFQVKSPELWYPVGYGKQSLYVLRATLLEGETEVHVCSKRFGLRKVDVVQNKLLDQAGTSFFFKVNNIPIFCGGSNWIPADNFIPRVSQQRYRDWLQLLVDGNQIMARVWGGGIYEEDVFYDAADEMGILVWQDFAFGCGNYPAFPEFLASVTLEATANVKRLRHHPCVVIYAGNNEDYQFRESIGLTYDAKDKNPKNWLKTDFPARYIYEKLLVDVVKEHSPDTFYHYGSPFGGSTSGDMSIGDLHQWNVWHGSQERYQDFDKIGGRFVSEFGMQGFPHMKTVDAYLGEDSMERYPQSSTVDFHNKADGHERRIALYMVENFRYTFSPFEQYIYGTQLMQAECLASAYRLWRRNWKGPGREYTSGALVWQLNDCWPVTSWAIVDYYLRPKMAYFAIKQSLAPVTVGIKRVEYQTPKDKYTRAFIKQETKLELWASNFTLASVEAVLRIKAFDIVSGTEIPVSRGGKVKQDDDEILVNGKIDELRMRVVVQPNQTTELVEIPLPELETTSRNARVKFAIVVAAYLEDTEGKLLARFVDWPQPLKYVHLQKPKQLVVSVDGDDIFATADVPIKGLAFEAEGDHVKFDDNLIDVVPGEQIHVVAKGLKGGKVATRYLGFES